VLLANLGSLEADILQKRLQKQAREMKPKNQTQCIHYARHGRCRDGDRCGFLHDGVCPLDQANAAAEALLRARLETYRRTGDGTEGTAATAGGGAPVSGRFHILCGRSDWDLPVCCVFLPREVTEWKRPGQASCSDGGGEPCSKKMRPAAGAAGALAGAAGESELALEASLNSFERKRAHALAEGMGLGHESRGSGPQRRIFIWRPAALIAALAAAAPNSTPSGGGGGALGDGSEAARTERDEAMIAEQFGQKLSEAMAEEEEAEAAELDDGLRLGQGQSWQRDYYLAKFGPQSPAAAAAAAAAASAGGAAVSHSCACIGSPCLRHCVHGASIGELWGGWRGPTR
jgi:hypothetical protein